MQNSETNNFNSITKISNFKLLNTINGETRDILNTDDLICFFFATRNKIACLYDFWLKGMKLRSEGKRSCLVFSFPGFVSKKFTNLQIDQLERQSEKINLCDLIDVEIDINMFIRILFKIRLELQQLYAERLRAYDFRSRNRKLCYTFRNPLMKLNGFSLPEGNCKTYTSPCICKLDCECQNIRVIFVNNIENINLIDMSENNNTNEEMNEEIIMEEDPENAIIT